MVFHKLYIDPGTGSMLFAILFSIIGVFFYFAKGLFVKAKFFLSGGKQKSNNNKIPIVFFSDDKRYWQVFKPICEELDSRGTDIVYMTASFDDPAFKSGLKHLDVQFIGDGNKAFSKLNFLNAYILVSTTPGLDVYQWKRSKNVDYYIHILHAAGDVTAYRMFGIDYYDAVLLSGEYQYDDIRDLERLRHLPPKELEYIGIPYMDEMLDRLNNSESKKSKQTTVLLAPSWGKSGILNRFGNEIINALLETGYRIIIRPHPQSFKSEAELMERLIHNYPDSEQLEWNRDSDNFDVLNKSDILISDFSGVIYDFALVYNKPVIYTDTDFDYSPYDAWWLNRELWTLKVLPRIGEKLTKDNINNIKELIDKSINSDNLNSERDIIRCETWKYIGEGAQRAADYIEKKLAEFLKQGGD